jgi:hypothetical protein
MSQIEISSYNRKVSQARRDYETRGWLRIIVTLTSILLSFIALISLIGIITHSQWVSLSQPSIDYVSKNLMIDIFISGPIYFSVFSGIAIIAWVLRTRL